MSTKKNKLDLIVNESYWNFSIQNKLREQQFLVDIDDAFNINNKLTETTINIAGALKSKDGDEGALYGIEIKPNGSSRAARIPLVRHSRKTQTIFKIIRDVRDLDNAIVYLRNLLYHMSNYSKGKDQALPKAAVIMLSEESGYLNKISMRGYLVKKANENDILLISAGFLERFLSSGEKVDIDKVLSKSTVVYLE